MKPTRSLSECSRLSEYTRLYPIESGTSSKVPVVSGIPQGTVLGPSSSYINDLPLPVTSKVRFFADDCLLYRTITYQQDHTTLQTDLSELEDWANKWGIHYVLHDEGCTDQFFRPILGLQGVVFLER